MWQLFKLTPREELTGSRRLQIVNPTGDTGSLAAAQVSVDFYTVPQDAVLIVTSCQIFTFPGAGQNLFWAEVAKLTVTGAGIGIFAPLDGGPFRTAVSQAFAHAFSEVYIEPGARLRLTAQYNAGGAANRATCDLTGILVPKGNFDFPA